MKNRVADLRVAPRMKLLAACGALTLMSMSALAQSPNEEVTTPPPPASVADSPAPAAAVEDKKIDQFADAYIAVQEIQTQASQQLGSTTDADKAQAVKQSAENQMIKAVERTGLQIEEFNQIVQAMATDVSLREKVSDRIGERKRAS